MTNQNEDTNLVITKELAQDIQTRLVADWEKLDSLRFALLPVEAYQLLSLVQLALIHPDIPETVKSFGDKFIQAFCDRYRDQLPAIVESLEMTDYENFLMTREEFDDLFDYGFDDDFA